ncbi:MAG: hypothetical protein ACOH5I_15160 [Oligoflexus sp.]
MRFKQIFGHYFTIIFVLQMSGLINAPTFAWEANQGGGKFWTPTTSEEQGDRTSAICDDAVVSGLQCKGRYCDNVALQCQQGLETSSHSWTDYFSEEGQNSRICPDQKFVTSIKCRGRYCDQVALRCSQVAEQNHDSCYWTASFSEEHGGTFEFPENTYLAGVQCEGRYCDNKRAYLCQAKSDDACQGEGCMAELAEKYAPLLRFDQVQGASNKCFPSSAAEYFDIRRSGSKERVCNTDYSSIQRGEVPIYYHYQSCGSNEIVIMYWFFYGYQDTCSPGLGAHDSDWERIAVKIKNDQIEHVMFYQHAGHYTKKPGSMQLIDGRRPVVYVGKNSHGSYHDDGGTGSCLYFEDYRNPGSADKKMETWKHLVHLSDNADSPEWMKYKGNEYWDGYNGPLARGVSLCSLAGCKGKDFNLGNTLCFGQCGCKKSDIGASPF